MRRFGMGIAAVIIVALAAVGYTAIASADEEVKDPPPAYTAEGVATWLNNGATDADRWQVALALFGLWTADSDGALVWQRLIIPEVVQLHEVSGRGDQKKTTKLPVSVGDYVVEIVVSDETHDGGYYSSTSLDDIDVVDVTGQSHQISYGCSSRCLDILTVGGDGYYSTAVGRLTFDVDADDDEHWTICSILKDLDSEG